jgi:hypothetical protein
MVPGHSSWISHNRNYWGIGQNSMERKSKKFMWMMELKLFRQKFNQTAEFDQTADYLKAASMESKSNVSGIKIISRIYFAIK